MEKTVYVARMIPQETIDELRKHFEVLVNPEDRALTKAELKEKAKGCDAIISLITDTIDGDLLDAVGPQCRIVANYAVGINNFDVAAATKRGVVLTNTPGVLDDATATHTFALLLATARQQTERVRAAVENSLTLVLINNPSNARELWWNIAGQLKEPVLTLSLLPDNACGPTTGGASLTRLRQWQLEQVAAIIRDVDEACHSEDTIPLSNALENRVLPWLQKLNELIRLWHETVMAGERLGTGCAAS